MTKEFYNRMLIEALGNSVQTFIINKKFGKVPNCSRESIYFWKGGEHYGSFQENGMYLQSSEFTTPQTYPWTNWGQWLRLLRRKKKKAQLRNIISASWQSLGWNDA